MSSQPLAFSYIRFSSEKQQLGDSLRRQVALAEDYASENGLTLDTQSYRDMGISAYKGRNAIEGKLATFLRAVDGGHIPPRSHLLVESLDRLSRHQVDEALELFLSIVRRGITIVTLVDRQKYSRESIKKDRGISLIISITVMMRAHEESELKSRRVKEAWKARTLRGGILTKVCPSWLRYSNGTWKVNPRIADVVRRIYALALEGWGALTIQRMLNQAKVPTFRTAKFWSPGLVTKLLNSTSVYGTLDRKRASSEPIEGYYPAIISREVYERVRLMSRSRHWKEVGSTKGRASNLFVGMSFCAGCGARMLVTTGHCERYFLQCSRSYSRAGCAAKQVFSGAVERALFEELLQVQPRDSAETSATANARTAVNRLESDIRQKLTERDTLIQLALATNELDAVARRLVAAEGELSDLRLNLRSARTAANPRDSADIEAARHMCAALTGGRTLDDDRQAMRERLGLLTRRIFSRILFDPLLPLVTMTYENGRSATSEYAQLEVRQRPGRPRRQFVPPTLAGQENEWVTRFAERLRQLRRRGPAYRTACLPAGRATYLEAKDLTPEEAAEIYALDPMPAAASRPER